MKTTETEDTIPGELKKFVVERDFSFRGERFKTGEELEVSAEDALSLLSLRVGRMIGAPITIERAFDGAHRISQWSKRYLVSDDWVLLEFLEDVPGWRSKLVTADAYADPMRSR